MLHTIIWDFIYISRCVCDRSTRICLLETWRSNLWGQRHDSSGGQLGSRWNMCSLSKKHTSVCVLLLLLSSSLIPLDFQNIVICCWKMSRTAKIVSIEPPDPISDPRVEEILMEMNVEVMSANKKAIRSIHKWSTQLYYLCCIIGGMCFIPRGKFLTKRDIRRHSIGIASKDIILVCYT